jgi:hypothetical protein
LTDGKGLPVRSLGQLRPGEAIEVQVVDGRVRALVEELLPATTPPSPPPLPHSS